MYYYSNVESGETCVRASQAAPRPAPLRSYVRRPVARTSRSLTVTRALAVVATQRSRTTAYRSRARSAVRRHDYAESSP
ncbi:unnamed protein product [Colias eurytheme]|nr:unnamed protein product [Colias eurytheme]